MNSWDTNNDGQVNLGDDINNEDYTLIMENCDMDGNGSVNQCEVHDCLVNHENEWRLEHCPEDFPQLSCTLPFICEECPDIWTCEDILEIAEGTMEEFDTNGDNSINMGDDIDPQHFAEI